MTTKGKHRKRRPRWVKVLATVLALVLVGGVAYAAVLARAGINGTIGRGQFMTEWKNAGTWTDSYGQVRTGSTLSADKRTLTMPQPLELYDGEHITVQSAVGVVTGSGRNGYVSGLVANGTIPAGWKVELLQGCGSTVSTGTGTASVSIRFTATSGEGPALDAAALGLGLVATALSTGQPNPPAGLTCPALGS